MSSDRRDFLKFLFGGAAVGATISPIELLIQSAMNQSFNVVHAQTPLEKFYLNIAFPGAPDRSTFDLFLDPYGDGQNVVRSPGFATCFGSSPSSPSVYDQAIYKTYKVAKHGIHAPWMWGQKMSTSDGFKNIYELMDNMILFQGVHSASPGHGLSVIRSEESNNLTLAGVLADRTSTPLNAIQINSPYSFKSKEGSFVTPLADSITTNMIQSLMSQFNASRISTYTGLTDNLNISFKNAIDNLNYDSGLRTPSSLNMKKTYEGALEIINTGLQDFATIWNDKLNKYLKVTEDAATDRSNFKGFLDKPIGNQGVRGLTYNFEGNKCLNSDLRSLIYTDSVSSMAGCFAASEFIAENKYASAVNTRISTTKAMMQTSSTGGSNRINIAHDQHRVGLMVRTLSNAVMFRAVSSCVYEFRKFLKTESKGFNFDNSVIRLSGEFSRAVRTDGSGADHGWQATTTLLFSGMVNEPHILGRIYKDGEAKGVHGSNYGGSWGVGAPITINGIEDYMTQGHVISSIASMLGISSPAVNSPTLLRVRNSKVELSDVRLKLKVVA